MHFQFLALSALLLDIIPQGKWNFLWITEMPFFEYDEETGEWLAMHHPFTMPMEECIDYLDTDKDKVRAKAFDLVLNGTELSSGSMRITDCELQNKMFELLGMEQEEIDAKFACSNNQVLVRSNAPIDLIAEW